MAEDANGFSIGIEEEYLLVEAGSGALIETRPRAFFDEAAAALGERVTSELQQSMIEVGTPPCATVGEARRELAGLRRALAEVAGRHGLALLACSTHPFADWDRQRRTEADRYREMGDDYRAIARRSVVCGMHVHVAVADLDRRLALMDRVVPWLPLLLALSASSPFWRGHETGLKAFRSTIFGEWPRTGIPESFADAADWRAYLDLLAATGVCPDPTKLWWDIRPSVKLPTLEVRIADVCTDLEDALTLAALCQALVATLARTPATPRDWGRHQRSLVEENKWRAQRSGAAAELADYDARRLVPVRELVERLIGAVREDAARLGCLPEVERARAIAERGTSADRQLAVFREALARGADAATAQRAVVAWLAARTVA